jgi:bisphosphoglycerate-dependent phosphoglycerate mutase
MFSFQGMRIRFTKQLIKLRDDTVTEVVFSNELTNIERKFLHKLAEELGLKSKSSGMNENRKITVTKQSAGVENLADSELHKFELNGKTLELLKLHFAGTTAPHNTNGTSNSSTEKVEQKKNSVYAKPTSLLSDMEMLKAAHSKAQSEREKRPGYALCEQKRSQLPAFHHKSAVSSLIKKEQIVLVSGETGCGKSK